MLTEPVVKYSELPEAKSDGECVECGFYPNAMSVECTDRGDMRVVRCTICDTLMRPHGE